MRRQALTEAFLLLILAITTTACQTDRDSPLQPTPGVPVRFGANPTSSRTSFGDPTVNADGSECVPVYWTHGDRVIIASPHCSDGSSNQSIYEIGTEIDSVSGQPVTNQNSAATFKAADGGNGLVWGDRAEANFYAVYPHHERHSVKPEGEAASAQLYIRPEQTIGFTKHGNVWQGANYAVDVSTGSRLANPDALMYAQRRATTSDSRVGLTFIPFSTVVEVTLAGYDIGEDDAIDNEALIIEDIALEAPDGTPLAGNFTARFSHDCISEPEVSVEASQTFNTISALCATADGRQRLSIEPGDTLKFNLFLIPIEGLTINADWRLRVTTSGGQYSMKLDMTQGLLVPSQIHRLNLPEMPMRKSFTPNFKSWVSELSDDTPLAHLSVPGVWRCYLNKSGLVYQTDTAISSQWAAGARAFHIDVRMARIKQKNSSTLSNLKLTCTDSEMYNSSYQLSKYCSPGDMIRRISKAVTPDEFAVCLITVNDYSTNENLFPDTKYYSTNHQYIFQCLSEEIADTAINNVYDGPLTGATTLGQLRGKVALILTTRNANTDFLDYDDVIIPPATIIPAVTTGGGLQEAAIYWGKTPVSDSQAIYHLVENTLPASNAGSYVNGTARSITAGDYVGMTAQRFADGLIDRLMLFSVGGNISRTTNHNVVDMFNPTAIKMYSSMSNKKPRAPLGIVFMNRFISQKESLQLTAYMLRINRTLLLP